MCGFTESEILTKVKAWASSAHTFSLVYQMTVDGNNPITDWHPTVDNKGPTIVVAKTNVGGVDRCFGGYQTVSWSSSTNRKGYQNDPNAFIFSLTNDHKHAHGGSNSVHLGHVSDACGAYGPVWGGGFDLAIGYQQPAGGLSNEAYNGVPGSCTFMAKSMNWIMSNFGHSYTCRVESGATCVSDLTGGSVWTREKIVTEVITFLQD